MLGRKKSPSETVNPLYAREQRSWGEVLSFTRRVIHSGEKNIQAFILANNLLLLSLLLIKSQFAFDIQIFLDSMSHQMCPCVITEIVKSLIEYKCIP